MTTPAELVAELARAQKHLVQTAQHAHRVFTDIRDGDLLPGGCGQSDKIRTNTKPPSHPEARAGQKRSQADRDADEWFLLMKTVPDAVGRLLDLAASVSDAPHRHEADQHCPHWTNGTADEEPQPCIDPTTGQQTVIGAGENRCHVCQRDPKLRVCVSCDPGLDHIEPGARVYPSGIRGAWVDVERYDGTVRQQWLKWTLCRSCYDYERYQARRKGKAA